MAKEEAIELEGTVSEVLPSATFRVLLSNGHDVLATMAGINPHSAVKAVSPQAPMTDTWLGDDFFHQGAFRLSYGFEYSGDLELSKDESVPVPIGSWDVYDWYLNLGPLSNVETKLFKGKVPTWTAFTQHPTYDSYWQARAVQRHLEKVAVPTLVVGASSAAAVAFQRGESSPLVNRFRMICRSSRMSSVKVAGASSMRSATESC